MVYKQLDQIKNSIFEFEFFDGMKKLDILNKSHLNLYKDVLKSVKKRGSLH